MTLGPRKKASATKRSMLRSRRQNRVRGFIRLATPRSRRFAAIPPSRQACPRPARDQLARGGLLALPTAILRAAEAASVLRERMFRILQMVAQHHAAAAHEDRIGKHHP